MSKAMIAWCLCGSKKHYDVCCGPFHLNKAFPQTAEQLMRSRYVAYALHLEAYLLSTWAKTTRPGRIEFENGLSWEDLKILKTHQGRKKDQQGRVTFKATFKVGLEQGVMIEKSQFIRNHSFHWVYLGCDESSFK